MSAQEQLWALYNKFYQQRGVLQAAPQLTINVANMTPETFDYALAEQEMHKMIGYLLGAQDASRFKVADVLRVVNKSYENQPFWKNLILDYLSFRTQKTSEELAQEATTLRARGIQILNQIRQEEAKRKAIIDTFSAAVERGGFPVDARRLVSAYFNMRRMDPNKAWETLITNPAFFAPIITTDAKGNTILSPQKAIEENHRLAKFLKNLRV